MPDEIVQGVNALLHGEVELVVVRAQMLRHAAGCQQIWSTLNPNAECVQPLVGAVRVLGLLQMPAAAGIPTSLTSHQTGIWLHEQFCARSWPFQPGDAAERFMHQLGVLDVLAGQ